MKQVSVCSENAVFIEGAGLVSACLTDRICLSSLGRICDRSCAMLEPAGLMHKQHLTPVAVSCCR